MNTGDWLVAATKKLDTSGITTARLDALVLLEDATGKDRSWLLAHPEIEIKGTTLDPKGRTLMLLNSQIERRVKHEPLAYIRGRSEFYGREFLVNKHTLEPRPETETMIDLLKALLSRHPRLDQGSSEKKNSYDWIPDPPVFPTERTDQVRNDETGSQVRPARVVDVGTGSGCLGVTVKLEVRGVEVIATDVSEECLVLARENAERLGARVLFYKGDLLKSAPHSTFYLPPTFALLANLPYVPDGHTINKAAMQEPKLAIFGGEDGLDLYRKLFKQIDKLEHKPRYVLTESLPFQHVELEKIAKKRGYKLDKTEDFIQVFVL